MESPAFTPALAAGLLSTTDCTCVQPRVTPSASTVELLMVTPSATCCTVPLSMISLATRFTRFDGMAKPMPMDPAVPEDVVVDAMDELMPITWPAALKVGPPELPGLTAASICTALVTMSLLLSSDTVTGRLSAETMPTVAVSS